jgi:predicted amino acid dehydrogenase
MTAFLLAIGAFVVAALIGSVPLGSLLVSRFGDRQPVDLNPHMLGVENYLRLVGVPLALAAFALDALKGLVALVLTGGNPWAALGVVVGHLFPLSPFGIGAPRGRGNGLLLGVLAGLHLAAGLPLVTILPAVLIFAFALAVLRYVTLATLGGLTGLWLTLMLPGSGATVPLISAWALLSAVLVWRHKASLARIRDRTEPRFGDPPSVRGLDPGSVRTAFMIHPMTIDDLWQPRSQRWLGRLSQRGLIPERLLRPLLLLMRPQSHGTLSGVELSDGRSLEVLLIGGPLLPDQIRAHPDIAERMATQGARLARELGAEAIGLGAYWSTIGDKGADIQRAVPEIAVTNGGAYTAGTVRAAVPGLLERFEREGGRLDRATAAVVGANGVVAFGVARTVAPHVAQLVLVGRDLERLARSADTLRRKFPGTRFEITTDLRAVEVADLVFTATSTPEPLLLPEHIRPGAWILDLGRPADVHPDVALVPGVHVVPGGVVRPPGTTVSSIDLQFGEGLVPACLAETMIMAATGAFDRASLGQATRSADIAFYLEQGERLGFEIVTRDDRVSEVEGTL